MVQSVESAGTSVTSPTSPQSSIDKDAFLKLFVAQLKHQDPLEPMSNTDFITQLAQFSSVEQLSNLNTNISLMLEIQALSQASQLIGFRVEAYDPQTEATIEGIVEEVRWDSGNLYLLVDKRLVPLTSIIRIVSQGGDSK